MNKTTMLFFVIFVEGYVVLASELLAIRLMIPFVGSGTETISIIISAVLLPLAIGYHFGGTSYKRSYAKTSKKSKRALSIRKILVRNLISAAAILVMGLSYLFLEVFFGILSAYGIKNRLAQTAIYSALFIAYPVFLLGQTVPLISNYFSRRKLSEITGRMLFFSTVGSFMGSVFSTIILMMTIGVHYTAVFTLGLLTTLVLILVRRPISFETGFAACLMGIMFMMNSGESMRMAEIVSNNAYNTASVVDIGKGKGRGFIINRSTSSMISEDPNFKFGYIKYIEDQFIEPVLSTKYARPLEILVIGAGGFTLGLRDTQNHYTFVDIDPALKEVSEKYFLKEPLTGNKQFFPMSARAYVHTADKKFDMVVIDAYTNVISIPMECITQEFLVDIKKIMKPNSVVIANVISSPSFNDRFTQRYHNTFASVFPQFTRQVIDGFNGWAQAKRMSNVLYIAYQHPEMDEQTIYTDDHNTYSIDR